MQKISKGSSEKKITKNKKKFGYYIPIIFIIIIVPLIVYGKMIELPNEVADFWKGGTKHIDFFNYYKFIALIIATVAAICAFLDLYLNNKLSLQPEKRYYIPMIIYCIFAVISSIMARSHYVAIEGFIEMNQGIFVLISYIVLTFILMNYIRDERDLKIIVFSFIALIIAEGFLGIGQFLGYDLFKTTFGQWMITPEHIRETELKFTFGAYTIYGTLYNTNFVGSFSALVLPLSYALYLDADNRKKSIFFSIIVGLAYAVWLGCNSRAGYFGVLVSCLIGAAVFRKVIKRNCKKVLNLFIIFITVFIVFNYISDGKTLSQFYRLTPLSESERIEGIKNKINVRFDEVSIEGNKFTIKTDTETLVGIADGNRLRFENDFGEKLDIFLESGTIKFVDKKYEAYSFYIHPKKSSVINAEIHGRNLELYMNKSEIKVISLNNKHTIPVAAPNLKIFNGLETLASNRGYIWSRTIPILKDYLFIGCGPDNFPLVFPQEDYVGRFNVGTNGMTDIVIDKPHNMYLQTAINTGVISLIALLIIWGIYLSDSFKIYIKSNFTTFTEFIGAATFLSITAYLVAGIFNDSVVSVAPLFWILLGMGIGINRIVKEQQNLL
jgi:hypothetical protein